MQAVSGVRVRWKGSGWAGLAGAAMLLVGVSEARATSDAGPPNGRCTDGGRGEWIACTTDDDCPGSQSCHELNICVCEPSSPDASSPDASSPEIPEAESHEGCSASRGRGVGGLSLFGVSLLGLALRHSANRGRSATTRARS